MEQGACTKDAAYSRRLQNLESVWWKRLLDVQRPYRSHLRSLDLGFVLDVGCGLGRNLHNLASAGVGVDHNPDSVAAACSRGLTAFVPDAFRVSEFARPSRFDSVLLSHVVEHMSSKDAAGLVSEYLTYLRSGGRVVFITPQEAGFRSDHTHVEFFDLDALAKLAAGLGLEVAKRYSFPFPRFAGKLFKYNEFVLIARKP